MVCFNGGTSLLVTRENGRLSGLFHGPQRLPKYKQYRGHLVCGYLMLREEGWFFFWSRVGGDQLWAAHMAGLLQLYASMWAMQPASQTVESLV